MVMSGHCSSWSADLCPKAMRFSCSFFSRLRSIWIPPGRDFGAELSRKIRLMWWSNRVTASIAEGVGISSLCRLGKPLHRSSRVCCVIHVPPLSSSVNYLFRLLPVSIKRDRAPGSTVRDGRTFRADRRMAESVHALIDTLSKAMWIRRRGYRAVPNQGQPHPGEIVLLLLLRKNRFLMRLAGFGVCDGRSVPRTDPQRQGRSSPTPARRRADSCQRSR